MEDLMRTAQAARLSLLAEVDARGAALDAGRAVDRCVADREGAGPLRRGEADRPLGCWVCGTTRRGSPRASRRVGSRPRTPR